jgi:RNA polymerase sigma factor (TIGR02999 family)
MSDATRILLAIENGEPQAAEQLLPLIYDELRRLAAQKLASEKPGHTLQATALVHEAYLRLVNAPKPQQWNSRGHFFVAAAEAMRRILVESARRRARLKRGGGLKQEPLAEDAISALNQSEQMLDVHESLDKLEAANRMAAELVKLRYFAGFTITEAADALGVSPRKADQVWAYARAWLAAEMGDKLSN